MRDTVRFSLDGVTHEVPNPDPTLTLLRYLRQTLRRTGTKEGCAEGDCGACTVAVQDNPDEVVRAVNACILFLPMLDGAKLWTVESLAGDDGSLHPIQQALVDQHGSQCGFCTPGFVMSLYAHFASGGGTGRDEINDAIAGNLCRCTGYGPIVAAAQSLNDEALRVAAESYEPEALEPLVISHGSDEPKRFFAPTSLAELDALAKAHPKAVFVAGATDVGLWVTKQLRDLGVLISVMRVPEMRGLDDVGDALHIGAGVRYSEAHHALAALHPDLGEIVRRLGAVQVRNCGTIGANIANGSPIGDTPPPLIALGATLVLRSAKGERRLPLQEYFLAYGKQDRRAGEYVLRVEVPKPPPGALFATYKISKRFDQDISAVCAGFRVLRDGARVSEARLAFGGMAATPKRASHAEQALNGKDWTEANVGAAMTAMAHDFAPLTDARGSAAYRLKTAQNLLWRFWLENSDGAPKTRVLEAAALDG